MDWERALRQAVSPVLAAYVVFFMALMAFARRKRREPGRGGSPGQDRPARPDLRLRPLVSLAAGGYATFLAIVLLFYLVLGDQSPSFIIDALVEGSILAALVVSSFIGLSVAERRLRAARDRRAGRRPEA